MLIQKDFKPQSFAYLLKGGFESLVNTEGFQTETDSNRHSRLFESLVNTEGFQTDFTQIFICIQFESLVNTEGFQICKRNYRCCV